MIANSLALEGIVSPLALLKNPMILIAIVGFGFVVGMPYLLENSAFLHLLLTLFIFLRFRSAKA